MDCIIYRCILLVGRKSVDGMCIVQDVYDFTSFFILTTNAPD